MFDRNTILALIVIGLILLLTPYYYRTLNPPPPKGEESPAAPPPVEKVVEEAPEQTPTSVPAEVPSGQALALLPAVERLDPGFVQVETPLFWIAIGSNGQVTSYLLREYKTYQDKPVALVRTDTQTGKTIGGFDLDFGPQAIESVEQIQFTKLRDIRQVASAPDSAILRAENDSLSLTLTYIFYPDRYGFDLVVKTEGFVPPSQYEYQVKWLGGVPVTEPDTLRTLVFNRAYAYVGDVLEKVSIGTKTSKDFQATGQTYFAAARSKYFMAAVIPQQPASAVEIHARRPNARSHPTSHPFYNLTLRKAWNGTGQDRYTIYWGPMSYHQLRSAHAGLEKTMDWGWTIIKPFSMAILWALQWLGSVIPNYGIVIIVFSIIVKLVLWPLTRKSQISMKKMAALQPDIKVLREKHKANPQAMNKAIMALYKERGVNPASGCIPLLFQMPLLYGLFVVFRSTIEFRQAPFVLWITDLSRPDYVLTLPFAIPLYGAAVAILPLIMGVTQFIMSQRTVTDPNQKMMAYIMPVFMTLIFNQFPSGLTLYYTLYNVWALLEQRLIKLPGS
jgi:YidC/Oxa1 family membrane protein insertase